MASPSPASRVSGARGLAVVPFAATHEQGADLLFLSFPTWVLVLQLGPARDHKGPDELQNLRPLHTQATTRCSGEAEVRRKGSKLKTILERILWQETEYGSSLHF